MDGVVGKVVGILICGIVYLLVIGVYVWGYIGLDFELIDGVVGFVVICVLIFDVLEWILFYLMKEVFDVWLVLGGYVGGVIIKEFVYV